MPGFRGLDTNGVSLKLLKSWWKRPQGYLYFFELPLKKSLPEFKQAVKKQPIFLKRFETLIR
jgi:hypothetical protein